MPIIQRPLPSHYSPAFAKYIDRVPDGDLLPFLETQQENIIGQFASIGEAHGGFRYAENKWSIKELAGHIADTERILAYRLLRVARNDSTALAGFEEDDYVRAANFNRRSLEEIRSEFLTVRQASLSLLYGLDAEAFLRMGTVNHHPFSAAALAYAIGGHAEHHLNILRERYLPGIRG